MLQAPLPMSNVVIINRVDVANGLEVQSCVKEGEEVCLRTGKIEMMNGELWIPHHTIRCVCVCLVIFCSKCLD